MGEIEIWKTRQIATDYLQRGNVDLYRLETYLEIHAQNQVLLSGLYRKLILHMSVTFCGCDMRMMSESISKRQEGKRTPGHRYPSHYDQFVDAGHRCCIIFGFGPGLLEEALFDLGSSFGSSEVD